MLRAKRQRPCHCSAERKCEPETVRWSVVTPKERSDAVMGRELDPKDVLSDLLTAPTFRRRSLTPNTRPKSSFSGCSMPGLRSSRLEQCDRQSEKLNRVT